MKKRLFDTWTDKYDAWFQTPVGQYVKRYETELLLELLAPRSGELILDAGCGTGIFTKDVTESGAEVVGMDLSAPMAALGVERLKATAFCGLCGDITVLPFAENTFDRVFSMTAIEFIKDGAAAIEELNRVVKKGGSVVVTTLNALSPWAERRTRMGEQGHSLFQHVTFRGPEEMRQIIPYSTMPNNLKQGRF